MNMLYIVFLLNFFSTVSPPEFCDENWQDVRLRYVEQTSREREQAIDMHRTAKQHYLIECSISLVRKKKW